MSIRYSQVFKVYWLNFTKKAVHLNHQQKNNEFGPSKDSIAIWVKQATTIMVKGQSKSLKDVKQLEKRLAILEKENEILSRIA